MKYNFDNVIDRRNTASLKWDATEERFGDENLLPLWVADMDFKAPDEVIQAIQAQAEHGIFGYMKGMDNYYNSIIHWMNKRHNWAVKKEWICHSPGIVSALALIVQAFSKPGDKIMVQPTIYYPFMNMIENHESQIVKNALL